LSLLVGVGVAVQILVPAIMAVVAVLAGCYQRLALP